ncbi:hypothetical protein FJR45_09840 [Sulfurimonas sediminis]|uniref:FlgO domain-containing protein n=1 Tax=Sulfurimonas sediminis TaxID=2590020 RepID=A0A7M1B399_9BACT|nr:FlgO family outer membrane protein [Sulfurimonas sediminis]QOP44229.1 hypothetical protein FJR45_09840 [Sulfurimonas sediminis]
MKNKFIKISLTLLTIITLSACSGHKIETLGVVPDLYTVASARNMHNQITNIPIVPTIGQASLIGASEFQKHKNIITKNIIVTSTVNVNNFKQSSNFGRLFSESMIANFKRLGWNVIDFRGQFPTIAEKKGEFYLSRKDVSKLPINSVIFVATYGEYKGGLLINMRILDEHNNVITASSVQLNDSSALALSKISNCERIACSANAKPDTDNFTISIKEDNCVSGSRCKCKNKNNCSGN